MDRIVSKVSAMIEKLKNLLSIINNDYIYNDYYIKTQQSIGSCDILEQNHANVFHIEKDAPSVIHIARETILEVNDEGIIKCQGLHHHAA